MSELYSRDVPLDLGFARLLRGLSKGLGRTVRSHLQHSHIKLKQVLPLWPPLVVQHPLQSTVHTAAGREQSPDIFGGVGESHVGELLELDLSEGRIVVSDRQTSERGGRRT